MLAKRASDACTDPTLLTRRVEPGLSFNDDTVLFCSRRQRKGQLREPRRPQMLDSDTACGAGEDTVLGHVAKGQKSIRWRARLRPKSDDGVLEAAAGDLALPLRGPANMGR